MSGSGTQISDMTDSATIPDSAFVPFVVEESGGGFTTQDNYRYDLGADLLTRVSYAALAAAGGAALVGTALGGTVQDALAWVTPQMFGAVGDGTTDDTSALQDMFDASTAIELGGDQYTYKISAALSPAPGTFIRGRGAKILQTVDKTTMLDVSGVSGITAEGVVFQDTGSGYVASDAQPHAAILGNTGTDNIKVRGCTFTQITFAAIRLRASVGIDISHNTFVGPGSGVLPYNSNLRCYPILLDAGCTDYRCIGNDISEALHGMRISRSSSGVVALNLIHDIPAQHGLYIGPAISGLAVTGNVMNDIALQAIKIQAENAFADITNVTITGNSATTCDQGITLSNADGSTSQTAKLRDIVVADNSITDCAAAGINVQNVVVGKVCDNIISDCGTSGITKSACDHLVVEANQIYNCVKSGIRDQSACTSVSILNNVLHNIATGNVTNDNFGILIQNLDAHTIRGNAIDTTVAATMLYGIYLAAGDQTNSIVQDNTVSGGTYGMRVASSATAFKLFKNNALEGTTAATFNNPALPSVASAATLVLPTQHDVVRITGTTNITTITAAGHTGHIVSLVFDDILTVVRGSNIVIPTDFTTSAEDTLTLNCGGSTWRQMSRSAN